MTDSFLNFFDLRDRSKRVAILWALALAVLAYFVFFSNHLLGNHALRLPWLHEGAQTGNGRWFSPILGHLHYYADIPVFMPAAGLTLAGFSAWLVAQEWGLSRRTLDYVVVFSIILLFPANLAHFYYSFMTILFFVSWAFVALAIFVTSRFGLWRIALAAFCIFLMLGSYQPGLSLFCVLAVASVIASLVLSGTRPVGETVRSIAIVLAGRGIAAVIGGVSYVISLKVLKINNSQTMDFDSFGAVLARFKEVVLAAFEHMSITQPDLLPPLKTTLLVILIVSTVASVISLWKSPLKALMVLALWPLLIIATKAVFLVSDPAGSIYEYRYNSSLAFLHAFSFAILLYLSGGLLWIRSVLLALSAVVMTTMIQANLVRQSILLHGQDHDLAIANRILDRIEQLEDFDRRKTYDLIRIGHYSNFRYSLFQANGQRIDRPGDGHMDFGELTDRWVDEDVFRLLGARIRFQQKSTDPNFVAKYDAVMKSGVFDDREPWPHESSVFISGDQIIVFMERLPQTQTPPAEPEILEDADRVPANFSSRYWQSTTGTNANFSVDSGGIELTQNRGGISTTALAVKPGDKIRQTFKGEILDRGTNGIPLTFAVGPVFLDKEGKVVGWWSSEVGRLAAIDAGKEGVLDGYRDVTAPKGAVSAHIGFYGPWSRDGKMSDGSVRITETAIERQP